MDAQLSKSFKASEFRCHCGRPECDAPPMKAQFIAKLQALRDSWGKPLSPTSGSRCARHNEEIGGAASSEHLKGNACDFSFPGPKISREFAALAEKHGFGGIGIGRHLVHIDDRGHYARWGYSDR